MKQSRLFKAEIIILAFVAVLWAVDLKTQCVPHAAAGALRQVVKVTPNSERTFRLLATMCYHSGQEEAGDKAAAQAIIIELREADPNDAVALYDLAQAYFDVGRYEDAVEAYRKAIEIEPYCICSPYYGFITHFNFAYAYETLGDLQSAVRTYERGLSLDPECRDAWERLADCYRELDQPDKSIETCKRALETDPNWTWPHVALAFDYNDVGRYNEAIAEWKHLIELEPEIAGLHSLLADVYLKTGQYNEAITACEAGLRINPDHPKSHHNLGRAYLQLGDTASAQREYETLKGLDAELAGELHELLNSGERLKPYHGTSGTAREIF